MYVKAKQFSRVCNEKTFLSSWKLLNEHVSVLLTVAYNSVICVCVCLFFTKPCL